MQTHDLAQALRERQYQKRLVAREVIDALSDEQIIDAYITCSCCGEKQVSPQQLRMAIVLATDAEEFFDFCDQLGRLHV